MSWSGKEKRISSSSYNIIIISTIALEIFQIFRAGPTMEILGGCKWKFCRIWHNNYFFLRFWSSKKEIFVILGGCHNPNNPPVGPALITWNWGSFYTLQCCLRVNMLTAFKEIQFYVCRISLLIDNNYSEDE